MPVTRTKTRLMINLSSFKISKYPDGHQHVVSDKDLKGETTLAASIHSFDDLFLIAQVLEIHPEIKHLQINYLLAARCDRRFSPGEAIDLKIVCDYLYRLRLETINVVKPHNPEALKRYLPSAHIIEPTAHLVDIALKDIGAEGTCFVSPDAGAANWVSKQIPVKSDLVQCSKHRDAQGNITGTKIDDPCNIVPKYDKFVIVDDLCDGGRTFTEIAKAIKLLRPAARVYLVVTHGIFSKDFEPFEGLIDGIYCTDSYKQFVIAPSKNNTFLKQIAV